MVQSLLLTPALMTSILTAVSEDGVHFKQASLAIEVPNGGTDPTSVRLEDGSWLMAIAHPEGTFLARSDDGLTFSLTDQSFPEGGPELWRFPDRVRLYIKAQNLLIYATTDGGASWSLEHSTPIPDHDPSMVQEADGSYTLYIKSFDLPTVAPRHASIDRQVYHAAMKLRLVLLLLVVGVVLGRVCNA